MDDEFDEPACGTVNRRQKFGLSEPAAALIGPHEETSGERLTIFILAHRFEVCGKFFWRYQERIPQARAGSLTAKGARRIARKDRKEFFTGLRVFLFASFAVEPWPPM
jgi:hypothetical protein